MQSDPELLDLLPEIRDFYQLPSLNLVVRKDWGASTPDNRKNIRAFIHDNIFSSPEILDLSLIPRVPRGRVSISHSKALGGVFWTDDDRDLGFDLELIDRARPEMMKRVSSPREMGDAPSMAALWTAKEAAFKTIPRGTQPYSVSQIIIGGWENISRQNSWQWRILTSTSDHLRDTRGITICQNHHAISFLVK